MRCSSNTFKPLPSQTLIPLLKTHGVWSMLIYLKSTKNNELVPMLKSKTSALSIQPSALGVQLNDLFFMLFYKKLKADC